MMSKSLCLECMKKLPDEIYPVSFDPSDQGARVVWTDLRISSNDKGGIDIAPKQSTLPVYIHDLMEGKVNMTVPPFLDQEVREPTILTGMLAGRTARLQQMELDQQTTQRAIEVDTLKWLQAGYPIAKLRALWTKVRVRGSHQVRKYLKNLAARISEKTPA